MAFFELIKGLLGGNSQEVKSVDKAGFNLRPDSNGLNFYLEKAIFDALLEGSGSVFGKVQLIALRMLEEQGLAQVLPNGFHISSNVISGLDDEQAKVLNLPERFGGSFTTYIQGRTGQSGFRVELKALLKEGQVPFSRKGPFLRISSQELYRLTPAELMGLEAWEYHTNLVPDLRGEAANLRLMAYLQTASRSGMRIDLSHFDRLEIVVPDRVGVVATRLHDGSLMLCPSFGDGSTPDQLDKRWSQLDLSAEGGVLRVNNRVVLLEPEKMAAVKEVLGTRRIPAAKVKDFIATPSAFLNAALVNLELGFSVRVAGVGTFQHLDFGETDAKKQDWFGLERHINQPHILQRAIQTPEELDQFRKKLVAAQQQGASSLIFAGVAIDISDSGAVQQIIQGIEKALITPSSPSEPVLDNEAKEKVSILLHEANEIRQGLLKKASSAQLRHAPDWDNYARRPFPHQQEGVEWMLGLLSAALCENAKDLYRLQGALLADDMGLGKSYMTLVTVGEYLAQQKLTKNPEKPILIVAPLSLLENWEDEVYHTFKSIPFRDLVVLQSGRDLARFRIKGAERESVQLANQIDDQGQMDNQQIRYALNIGPEMGSNRLDMDRRLVLTTYQTLRDYQFSLCSVDWGVVIFDEAQNIKNPNALQTRAAKGLKADFKLLATGTPVENSLADFWCLMDTAQPGLLGDWAIFRDRWIKPILEAPDDIRDKVRCDLGQALRAAVGSFMLRRVKESQLKGLPNKTLRSGVPQLEGALLQYTNQLSCCMTGIQLKAYDHILEEYRTQRTTEDMRGKALSVLQQLREISLHPRLRQEDQLLVDDAKQARHLMTESGKLAVLLNVLDQIKRNGEKVILFMVTKRLQRLLKLWLDKIYSLNIAIINGDTAATQQKNTDIRTRKQLIADFEARTGFNVLIMSPVAAGVGLTVVGANHVVHLERHWNPAKEAQASDRVYRIGQTKDVFIHLPAVLHPQFDSFDVHLDRLLQGKLMLKDAVVVPEPLSESEIMRSMGL